MRYVPPFGNTSAKIMVIGEAPGEVEELELRPFIGPSGQEFARMFAEAGLNWNECFLTNVVRVRPPGNDISAFIATKPGSEGDWVRHGQFWVRRFVLDHLADLNREIAAVNPETIILAGNTPLRFVAGLDSITRWRGSQLTIDGRRMLPVIHPAAIMRDWSLRPITVHDLRRAKKSFEPPPYRFVIRPSFDDAVALLRSLQGKRIAVDIETFRRTIVCIGLAWSKLDAVSIVFTDYTLEQELALVRELLRLFGECELVGQNFLYDAFMIAAWWGRIVVPAIDTMIAQNVFLPGLPKSLDFLASLYCEFYRYWKDDAKEWQFKDDSVLANYNATDCVVTYEVAEALERLIDADNLREQFRFQMSLFRPTLAAMLRGVRLDAALRDEVTGEIDRALEETLAWLREALGADINPFSPKQLKELFYERLAGAFKLPVVHSRQTGAETLNDDALSLIAAAEPLLSPVVERIRAARTLRVVRSTFLDVAGPKNRFYCSLNPAGSQSYRFSSSANPFGWGTNGQNIPKWSADDASKSRLPNIRRMFIADEDHLLWSVDLTKADLYVVVWEADDDDLREQLRQGKNVYREAVNVVGLPYSKAKSFIHGTNYGGSYRTMARSQKISEAQARAAQEAWFARHPGIKRWHARVWRELSAGKPIANRFGYRIHFFGRNALPEALAWIPQSTVACVINRAWKQIEERVPEAKVLLQVHDELLGQIHVSCLNRLNELLDCMRVVVPYEPPLIIPCELKIGRNWGEMQPWQPDRTG